MADEFKKLNLVPIDGDTYYQKFYTEYNEILPPCSLSLYKDESKAKEYALGDDYVFRGFTGSGDFKAPVVFSGYGLSTEKYDDYAGIDVSGKVVIVFKFNPSWKPDGVEWAEALPRIKSKTAADHGAKGILFVSPPNDKDPQKPIGSVYHGEGIQDEDFPQLHIDLSIADDFFSGTGNTLKELQTMIDSLQSPHSIELKTEAEIVVNARYTKEQETMNIAGIYPGSDPALKNEYVIIGGHLDHAGQQGKEIYFPGANDNASGAASVLELARAFAGNKIETKRSIVFVLFSAEESGLEGAGYFAENMPFDTLQVTAMINIDCIGHGDSLKAGNGKSAPELWKLARDTDKNHNSITIKETWNKGGADATPFYEKGIPALYFVTKNSYTYLHQRGDLPETLNPDVYEECVDLIFLTAYDIANGGYTREKVIE